MNSLDHMLNGSGSRRHHQEIIRQVQQEKFAREAEAAQGKSKAVSPLYAAMIALINLVTK